ncbi:MAG: hypothetical protein R6U95_00715 [Bacteroidales bacterium]
MTHKERYSFNSNDLLFRIFLYKKPLLIISACAFIISTIIAFFVLTPQFRSSVILFPAPSASISQSLISTVNTYKSESVFGEEEELEQILQVLQSDELRNRIIEKYDLWKHYEIDTAEIDYPRDKMMDKFYNNIHFSRTKYMAIEVEVFDKSPDTAAYIANNIMYLIDSVMNKMTKRRAQEAYKIVREEYTIKEQQINELEDSLGQIMSKGVFDFESQSEVLNKAYADALASENMKGAAKIKSSLDTLAKYGSSYMSIRDFLIYEKEQLSMLNSRLKEAKVNAERDLTHYFVVNKAYKSDKKAKPKRLMIVVISTIATFLFAFVVLVIIDLFKDFKDKKSKAQIETNL